jgi:hypothetical protein
MPENWPNAKRRKVSNYRTGESEHKGMQKATGVDHPMPDPQQSQPQTAGEVAVTMAGAGTEDNS